MTRTTKNRFTQQLFTRPASDGRSIVYVRFIDAESGLVLATRSTGLDSDSPAKDIKASVTSILADLNLEAIARMKDRARRAALDDDERIASMPAFEFFSWFWSDESYYLSERQDADRPLSKGHILVCRKYVQTNLKQFEAFSLTPVRELRLSIIEAFVRKLRKAGKSLDVVKRNLDTIRTPINWAQARGLIEAPFSFKTLVLPRRDSRERGILSDEEILKIVDLPYAKPWVAESGRMHWDVRPRPRQSGGRTYDTPPMLDVRQKAAIVMALFAGLRRGEIRGLRWCDIDAERKLIEVRHNYVRFDGDKAPKKMSLGTVPLAVELEQMLDDLRALCESLGYTGANDYVLPGTARDRPVNEVTIRRGWERALELIGIPERERLKRNLLLHGARHAYTTRLLDSGELSPAEVAKLTRHKDLSMLSRYGGHLRDETIEKGRKALSFKKEADHASQ